MAFDEPECGFKYELEHRYADAIRAMLRNEDTMVANRMNWMLGFQGFLFAAASQVKSQPLLIGLLAFLGIGVSLSMIHEFTFSTRATEEILCRWNVFKARLTDEGLAAMPPAFAGGNVWQTWWDKKLAAPVLLPRMLAFTWVIVAIITIIDFGITGKP